MNVATSSYICTYKARGRDVRQLKKELDQEIRLCFYIEDNS